MNVWQILGLSFIGFLILCYYLVLVSMDYARFPAFLKRYVSRWLEVEIKEFWISETGALASVIWKDEQKPVVLIRGNKDYRVHDINWRAYDGYTLYYAIPLPVYWALEAATAWPATVAAVASTRRWSTSTGTSILKPTSRSMVLLS